MSKENVADYTPIPTFETQEPNGKDPAQEEESQLPASRRFRRTYFTRRDCIIVLIVVGLALAAIVVSLVFGLPALEAKRLAMANANSTESEELISNLTTTTIAPSS
ncbi:uncharacterized protein LOC100902513 isoform X1 [Galendromus occidentalis]|uniref:Uncharacterized protein LOC100902513 isoform X1 n=1 Tax=Galendromus occidentalis TaxID=34638 RepID=A0AAJ6QX36_9ACAR|nr:uncharacterized protein LOC100902513 isoform X1 [Galendromus occidentalis]